MDTIDTVERDALAAELMDTEGLDAATAQVLAQAQLTDLAQYAANWHAERRDAWHALRAWAKSWDTMALAARIYHSLKQGEV